MKNAVIFGLLLLIFNTNLLAQTWEYKTITVVESIIPNGIGRSRMISSEEARDFREFTTQRTEEDNERNKADRGEIRLKNFEETKLLNFFNMGGIRFQNIAANDAVVTSKINALAADGWELVFVNSGVESYSGPEDENGIYITRYIFKRSGTASN
ncbi:hypothetical protein GCM10023115_28050 [Pontixanthobacter gangjinensis]|uniref:DUF4177 domain-containing protein n=1 Tax=Christiangramia aestuarii TaxID=1028746 RepID=A0A7K1LMS8_9FLAO|nr:hypothetical protein [Christiangramia aestuarii]MUP42038.1 hypothetical protein [Christiangramia aestuarii]